MYLLAILERLLRYSFCTINFTLALNLRMKSCHIDKKKQPQKNIVPQWLDTVPERKENLVISS